MKGSKAMSNNLSRFERDLKRKALDLINFNYGFQLTMNDTIMILSDEQDNRIYGAILGHGVHQDFVFLYSSAVNGFEYIRPARAI